MPTWTGAWSHVRPARGSEKATSTAMVGVLLPEPAPEQETLRDAMGARILRMKGLVAVAGEPGPRAVHMVQHALYPAARLPAWPDADRSTRLVFIGRDLEEGAVAQILDSLTRETSTPPE